MTERTVLVTGASRGIGAATVEYLAERGFHLFAGVRQDADGQALTERISGRVTPVILDVTDAGSITEALSKVQGECTALTALVNNAGIVVAGPLEALPMDEIRYQFEVNVFGVIAVTRAFLPLLRAARGRIVNVSSINGRIVTPFGAPYGASKFALEAISDGLRMELLPQGIQVAVVQPGSTRSAIWETSKARAVSNIERFEKDAMDLYGRVVAAIARRSGTAPGHAMSAQRVAKVIAHAITARRPKTRYLVGRDARLGAIIAAVLPDRVKDWLLTNRKRPRP